MGHFETILDDVPGSLHSLSGIIASLRGNILNVFHDRVAAELPVGKTRVVLIIETRGRKHLENILSSLRQKGFDVRTRCEDNRRE